MIAGGLITGMLLSVAGANLLRSILHGVQPHDASTLLAASAVLGAIAVAAGILAARPAAKVDPAAILREE
jgi:ABC-type antimicrobial peptide transport system permease subunit